VTSKRKGYNSKCIHGMMARNTRLFSSAFMARNTEAEGCDNDKGS